jgi:AbiU2
MSGNEGDPKEAIVRVAKVIGEEVDVAIAYYEIFAPTGRDEALLDRVNAGEIHAGFNVVSETLELATISALCRIWDKNSDAARLAEITKSLRKHPELASDLKELEQWLSDVERVEKSEVLHALREFRNVRLAHRYDPNRPDPRSLRGARRVQHGDAGHLLDDTELIVGRLNALVE